MNVIWRMHFSWTKTSSDCTLASSIKVITSINRSGHGMPSVTLGNDRLSLKNPL